MESKQTNYADLAQERVIRISDLIKEIFKKLWLVIIFAIIFALLFGGYKYMKDKKAAHSETQTVTEIKDELDEDEQVDVNNILMVYDNLAQQRVYTQNSVLLQINPYDESNITLQYHFSINGVDEEAVDMINMNSKNLLDSYSSYINNGGLIADLKAAGVTLDAQYLTELISTETDSKSSSSSNTDTIMLGAVPSSFDVKIIHKDKASCQELADEIALCLETYKKQLDKSIGAHTLTLVNQAYTEVVDYSIWNYKLDRVNSMGTMEDKFDTLYADLNDAQKKVVDKYTKQIDSDEAEITDETAMPETELSVVEPEVPVKAEPAKVHVSKKYLAVGALGGIVLACLLIILRYILRGAINTAEEIQYLYGLNILGEVDEKKRNPLSVIWDRVFKGTKPLPVEDQKGLFQSNLKVLCEKKGVQKLMIATGTPNATMPAWMQEAAAALKESGVEVLLESNVLMKAAAMEKLADCNSIVWVEAVNHSRYEDVIREVILCSECNINILGSVVLH